jgi:hypothetical protein
MARKAAAAGRETTGAWFRRHIVDKPHWLEEGRGINSEIYAQWESDHSGESISQKIKNQIANNKSIERSRGRKKKRKGRKAGAEAAAVAAAPIGASRLERLEESIDECRIMAKSFDRGELEGVVKHLRFARNQVVMLMGK